MSALGFDGAYLHAPDSGHDVDLAAGLSVVGEGALPAEELGSNSEQNSNFEIDSLHQIASQVAAGETLDEVLASSFRFITALVGSKSCVAYVLQGEKFELWVWQTHERLRESAPSVVRHAD